MKELSKAYDPVEIEQRWTQTWAAPDFFRADPASPKPAYCIVIPPPNVTGSLHMGHALTATIQDILIRWKRMSGFEVLWLPGTDHAGIATQTVVERELRARGLDRRSMTRDEFLGHVWTWKEKSGSRITLQHQRLGASLDWSRERFTLDPGLSAAVREVFVRLLEEGLIYRDDRLVNWDPASQTAISDLEVESEEEDGFLWHIAYPVDGTDERLVVATTRPETMLGDTAVAIHPDDPRYTHLHGRQVRLPLCDRLIPIVCDPEAADMTFGSGAVKITPGHDFNDFETGRRNGLPLRTVLDRDARICGDVPERFVGLERFEARRRIVAELDALGLLLETKAHRLAVPRSQRSGVVVEPMTIGPQWFVRTQTLAEPAIAAVRDGRIRFVPESWDKTYFHWMENIRDWCISRQLWWGHRIPAWTCGDCGLVSVLRHDPQTCPGCGGENLRQDEDVLDTWFSSGLWPFSTLGWPEETADLKKFYPTAVLETGFDILFFWVARMIMLGMHFTGEVPFRTVFLHAMVRDRNGQKMSKTRGNVIDPLHLIDGVRAETLSESERETYSMLLRDFPDGIAPQGADALRFTLAQHAAAGRDIKLDVKRVEGYRAFMNKVWNAVRFALMHLGEWEPKPLDPARADLSVADRWILTRLAETVASTETALQEYRFSDAAQGLYEFIWGQLCDWYLELAKPLLYGADDAIAGSTDAARTTIATALDTALRLLHPIAPYITEELWQALPRADAAETSLAHAAWPATRPQPSFPADAARMERAIAIVSGVRRIRGESDIPPSRALPLVLVLTDDAEARAEAASLVGYLRTIGRITEVRFGDSATPRPPMSATTVEAGFEIVVPLEGVVDFEAERQRIRKELAKVEKDIAFFRGKLGNPNFVQNAKPDVVEETRAKLADAEAAHGALQSGLARLGGEPG